MKTKFVRVVDGVVHGPFWLEEAEPGMLPYIDTPPAFTEATQVIFRRGVVINPTNVTVQYVVVTKASMSPTAEFTAKEAERQDLITNCNQIISGAPTLIAAIDNYLAPGGTPKTNQTAAEVRDELRASDIRMKQIINAIKSQAVRLKQLVS